MLHTLPILVSLLAQAAPTASSPGTNPAPKDRAQALLKEGSTLYKQGDYAGALQKFEAAYGVYPSPKLQFNIAQADRQLGKNVEAVEAFETFLVQAPDAGPDLIAEARQSLAEMKPKLGQIRVDAAAGAQVTVDQRAVGFTPITRLIWVVPGSHKVIINHPSFQPMSTDVTVAAGEIRMFAPTLLRAGDLAPVLAAPPTAPAPAVASAAPAAVVTAPPQPTDGARSSRPWYFWTAAAATAAFGASAVIAGLSANAKYSDLENGCDKTAAGCTTAQIDGVKSRATLANVLWILAGASAIATGVTFFVGNHEAGASIALRF